MIYEHLSDDPTNVAFCPERFVPVDDRQIPGKSKPYPGTGLWASPANSAIGYRAWAEKELPTMPEYGFSFSLAPGSQVLDITSVRDLDSSFIRTLGSSSTIDWLTIENEYDAVFVHGPALRDSLFWGWDFESLLVLDPNCIKTVSGLGTRSVNHAAWSLP